LSTEYALHAHPEASGIRRLPMRAWNKRGKYLSGAICVALCAIMLAPLMVSVFASIKTTQEAAALPPTYLPHTFSLESYARLADYQAGLLTYLANSGGTALLTIAFCIGLTIPAGYALARFPVPAKEFFFVVLLLALIIPYQALLTPIFFMFVQMKLHNSLVGLAILHTAIQLPFSLYIMRNAFEAVPREFEDSCLLPDDEGGALLATEHLVKLGRRRIAHVSGPEHFEAVRLRRDGYRKALAAGGLDEPEGFHLPGVWSEDWGREAVARLFKTGRTTPDAIFCGNDQIARGISDALRERGIAVPDTVSIVGFDNWEIIAAATRPPLTTIDMNLSELGREAGRRLIGMIAGEPMRGVHRLPCSLIIRDSCGARSGQMPGKREK
jgi:hypothetical protein